MMNSKKETWLPVFFAIAACSWVPHWACHYYRIETGSSFAVGSWNYSVADSIMSMIIYSILISLNIISVSFQKIRFISALLSGILHITLGILHIIRLNDFFTFQVFGYDWPLDSSIREVAIVLPFGILCLIVAFSFLKRFSKL
jgi:hypothetical protein